EADRDLGPVPERVADGVRLLDRRDDRPRAAVARAIRDVLRPERRRARDDERAELQRADDRRLPRGETRQHDHHRIAAADAEPGERVHAAVRRLLDVPEREPRGVAGLVLPVERDPAPVRRPRVDERAEVELLRDRPGEVLDQVLVPAADADHAATTRPRRADASMYFRDTGERSSGRTITSITTNDSMRAASASAARSSSTRST